MPAPLAGALSALPALAAVLAASAAFGAAARRLRQPPAVGHMIAGVALGPSLLGLLAPGVESALFGPAARGLLFPLGRAGVLVYMFCVGLEFDASAVRSRLRAAVAISAAGMAVPLALGAALGAAVHGAGLFGPGVSRAESALFVGAALSITAFPMLARILDELKLTETGAGRLAMAAGCLDDLAAWALLTFGLVAGGSSGGLAAPAAAFAVGVLFARVPALARAGSRVGPAAGAWLLPVYLASAGLNTHLDALPRAGLLPLAAAFLAAACAGKLGGCYAASRAAGEAHETSLAVGALMNARGLMELIVLDAGLRQGIIMPPLYSILVLMAVVTTAAAGPLAKAALAVRVRAPARG